MLKKIIVGIGVTLAVLILYMTVGQAADESDTQGMTVTVEQIITVTDQISEHKNDAEMLANLMWNECRGVPSTCEKAAVCWIVLNRVDDERWPDTIAEVITQRNQFAYTGKQELRSDADRTLYDELLNIARDVLIRWLFEKQGVESVGRVLPKDYVYFAGRNGVNFFRSSYRSKRYWDWSLPNPYEEDKP